MTSRLAAQIETVRLAHLQIHGKPVSVGGIVDHGGDRSPNLDRTGTCVEVEIAEIVRNLLDEDFVTAMGVPMAGINAPGADEVLPVRIGRRTVKNLPHDVQQNDKSSCRGCVLRV